jgi:hypothetical protein
MLHTNSRALRAQQSQQQSATEQQHAKEQHWGHQPGARPPQHHGGPHTTEFHVAAVLTSTNRQPIQTFIHYRCTPPSIQHYNMQPSKVVILGNSQPCHSTHLPKLLFLQAKAVYTTYSPSPHTVTNRPLGLCFKLCSSPAHVQPTALVSQVHGRGGPPGGGGGQPRNNAEVNGQ